MYFLKTYILLALFCFSTVSSFATIHLCKGEVTDIEFVTIAACAHEKVTESSCHKHCCSSDEEEQEDNDCCDTQQLSDDAEDFTIDLSTVLSDLIVNKITNVYNQLVLQQSKEYLQFANYLPPPLVKDIPIEIQCFRI